MGVVPPLITSAVNWVNNAWVAFDHEFTLTEENWTWHADGEPVVVSEHEVPTHAPVVEPPVELAEDKGHAYSVVISKR